MTLDEMRRELMKDESFRREYEKFDLRIEMQEKWIKAKLFLSRYISLDRKANLQALVQLGKYFLYVLAILPMLITLYLL